MSNEQKEQWFRDDVKRRAQEFEESMTSEELKEKICLKIDECWGAIVQTESIVKKHPEFDDRDIIGNRELFLYVLYLALENIEKNEETKDEKNLL